MLSAMHAQGHRLVARLVVAAQHQTANCAAGTLHSSRTAQLLLPAQQQQIRFATKKAGGSSNNGRDSAGRRLGIKLFPGLRAKAGAIIVRQRGRKFYAGDNVGMGSDHTIFSKVDGIVKFTRHAVNKKRNVVHVLEAGA